MNQNILELINSNQWNEAFDIVKSENDVFTEIINGKNLFHYACMRGNSEMINKYLELNDEKIYRSDNNGNNGFHLLAINDWDNILLEKLQKYPIFLKLKNGDDDFICNLVINKFDTLRDVVGLMEKNNYVNYFNYVNEHTDRTIVLDVIDLGNSDGKYFEVLRMLYQMGVNFNVPSLYPPLIYSISYDFMNSAKFMLKILKVNVNVTSKKQITPLILSLHNKLEGIANMILDLDPDVNYSGFENKYVPLSLCFKNGLNKLAEKIIKNPKIDLDKRDTQLNTPIYYLIKYIGHNKKIITDGKLKSLMEMLNYMIDKCDLQNLNIENETPFHLLIKYKLWEFYKERLAGKKLDINIQSKNGITPLAYVKDNDIGKIIDLVETSIKNDNVSKLSEDTIILPQVEKDDKSFGLFNSDGIHNVIYLICMLKKYKKLTIPMQWNVDDKKIWEKYKTIIHSQPDDKITQLLTTLTVSYFDVFYCILPCMILWKDKDIKYFTKESLYLQRALGTKHRFIMMRVTIIVDENLLHANMVIYDKKLNKLIRFEPYGDWEFHDSYSLDDLLVKIFKNSLSKKKQKSMKYIRPSQYLDKTKFQTTSLGDHYSEKNLGDPGGYCLAWSFWFLELKLKNPKEDEAILVKSALNKIIREDSLNRNPLLTHIRLYAKRLDKEKNIFLENIGISKTELYKMSYDDEKIDLIKKYTEKYAMENIEIA